MAVRRKGIARSRTPGSKSNPLPPDDRTLGNLLRLIRSHPGTKFRLAAVGCLASTAIRDNGLATPAVCFAAGLVVSLCQAYWYFQRHGYWR